MNRMRKAIIMLGIIIALGGGLFYIGVKYGSDRYINNVANSRVKQLVVDQDIKQMNLDIERLQQVVNETNQIVLLEESGISNIKLETSSDKWNSFITNSSTELSVEYRVLIGIDVKDIHFVAGSDYVTAVYSDSSIKVLSLEIVNKSILTNRALFGKSHTDEQKIALEKELVEQVKEKVLNDNIEGTKHSMEKFLYDLGSELHIEIKIDR